MKRSPFLYFSFSFGLFAQVAAPPADPAPDTVLATIDGKKLTYGELQRYLDGLGPDNKKAALEDRKSLVEQYALMTKLVEIAEKEKLPEQTPYREVLEASRRQILAQAEYQNQYLHLVVTAGDQKKFYDEHKEDYTQVQLQVLYLGFVNDAPQGALGSGKKYRTEEEAKKQIESIRQQIHSKEDFIKLVKQYSEDEASKAKNGEYGTMKKSDNLPVDIKAVIFNLKQGEVSQPVPQRNGFYLFRAEVVGLRPYDEVRDEIYNKLKETRLQEWMLKTQKDISIKIENPAFFAQKGNSAPKQ